MDIKDYLHLYLGCKCIIDTLVDRGHNTFIIGVHTNGNIQVADASGSQDKWNAMYIKPILRKLSDMTEEDLAEWQTDIFEDGYHLSHDAYRIGIDIDSNSEDGYKIEIYPDGSMNCICKDNNETYPFNGGELFRHLLSKHFDLFGLIENGLAIDKNSLK